MAEDDDFSDKLGEMMTDEVGIRPDDDDTTGDTGDTDTTDGEDDTDSTGSVRQTRSQYAMYLSDELQDELNDRFSKFNARRALDDEEQVEKHADFLEGLVRAGLDSDDLEEYIESELD